MGIIQLLRSDAKTPTVLALLDDLLWNTLWLATDEFAHYVVEEVVEHGADYQRRYVIDIILSNWLMLMQEERGARVLVKVLVSGDWKDVVFLASCLLEFASDKVAKMAASKNGSMVIQALLKHTRCEEVASLRRLLCQATSRVPEQHPGWKTRHKGPNLQI